MELHLHCAALTDPGRRPANEDHCVIDEASGVYVVADGTASRGGGGVAARIACETVRDELARNREALVRGDPLQLAGALRSIVGEANERILQRQAQDAELSQMATTVVLGLYLGDVMHLAHAGDSRAFLYRGGELTQLTRDHSLENYLKDNPQVRPKVERPGKTLLSALGLKRSQLRVDYSQQQLQRDDLMLLCSDGLTDAIPAWILREILAGAYIRPIAETAQTLVRAALSHGGMDNVTAVLVHATDQPRPQTGETVMFQSAAVPHAFAPVKKQLGWLTFAEGARRGEVLTVEGRLTFGAAPTNSVIIGNDDFVSSQHAEVFASDLGFEVRDLGSTNGTFLNNIRVRAEVLVDGDVLRIGTTPLIFKCFRF